ncbi:YitT family protein [Oceanobacillus bengalensis]|uniref:YitT family protein n=1 Tax=Oceanobacillus bengalensis TaxID=1435466 RepID=A0A494YWF7_9BACI|nr:YitT family protein [Oceanobacillus bengalensis]RKQ14541.1 YitT family protein [Oceanobacillus bengalensis]
MNPFLKKYGLVIAGGTIQGLGMGLFLFPHSIPSGGAGGIAVLLNYWFNMSMGVALWIVNFSLLLFGVKILGKRFALWTIVSITVTSLSVDFFETSFMIQNRNLVYDLVFGSLFLGTGIGLLMRQGVSNGGVGVVALIISTKRKILPGKPLFFLNMSIFVITAMVVDWKIIVLALISQWLSTRVVDLVCQMSFQNAYTLGWRKKP